MAALAGVLALSAVPLAYIPGTYRQPSTWGPSWSVSAVRLFTLKPRSSGLLSDEEIYLGTLRGFENGAGFYRAQDDMFNRNPGRLNTRSPLTFRQPLLTLVWRTLRSGTAISLAFALLAGISMIAAHRAAESFVAPVVAMLAPVALGLVYVLNLLHPPRLLYTEMWAGPLVTTAGALCALALVDARAGTGTARPWVLGGLGAASGLLAMSIRELAAIPMIGMLAAQASDRPARARHLWTPWAASLGIWAALFARHAEQVRLVSGGDAPAAGAEAGSLAAYLFPGLGFISACVRWESTTAVVVPLVLLLCVLACAGVWAVRGAGLRVLVAAMTFGSLALLATAGTPGQFPDGSYTGYWGFLFLPPVIAWAPLGLGIRRANRS